MVFELRLLYVASEVCNGVGTFVHSGIKRANLAGTADAKELIIAEEIL